MNSVEKKVALCVDNKVRQSIVDVNCPKSRRENVFAFHSTKNMRRISTLAKTAKPAVT